MDKKRFKDFLEANKDLSTKMLSARLRDLEELKIIEKRVVSTSPVLIEYHLTKKGRALGKVLYEMSIFSMYECSREICKGKCPTKEEFSKRAKKIFC